MFANMSEKQTLARIVNANRSKLLKYYSLDFDGSASQAMKALTERAVKLKFVVDRHPPPAAALRSWIVENEAPQWACRSAFEFLLEYGWEPQDDVEQAIAARYLLLNQHTLTSKWEKTLGPWLELAIKANRENDIRAKL